MATVLAQVDYFRGAPGDETWISYLCFNVEDDYPQRGDEIAVMDWAGNLRMAYVIDIDNSEDGQGSYYIVYSTAGVSEASDDSLPFNYSF